MHVFIYGCIIYIPYSFDIQDSVYGGLLANLEQVKLNILQIFAIMLQPFVSSVVTMPSGLWFISLLPHVSFTSS